MPSISQKRNHGRDDIETSPKIPIALKVHKVLRTYNEDNICKMYFHELVDEGDPFQIQWYRKEGDPEVCGHNQLPLTYGIDQTCSYCKERYKGNEKCLECKLWTSGFMKLVLKSNQHLSHFFFTIL